MSARVAAAVFLPAADAVSATPRAVFVDLYFVCRGELLEILAVVRELGEVVFFDVMQRVGKSHLAIAMMMPVAFAVGCDMREFRPIAAVRIRVLQALGENFAVVQQTFERDSARNRSVVEEQRDLLPGGCMASVGARRIDATAGDIDPLSVADSAGTGAPDAGPGS